MKSILLVTGLLAGLVAHPALAVEPVEGARLGSEAGEIAAALGESGYTMTRFKRDHDTATLTAVKDGRSVEVYLNADSGIVTRVNSDQTMDDGAILAKLEGEGYRIQRFEREGNRLEVYADKDGRRWELKLDRRDGRILEIESE